LLGITGGVLEHSADFYETFSSVDFFLTQVLFLSWIFSFFVLIYKEQNRFLLRRRDLLICIALSSVATALMLKTITPFFRVLGDEANHLSVSRIMYLEHKVYQPILAKQTVDGLVYLQNILTKRPPFFSYLIYCLHSLIGFTYKNSFALNALISSFFLSLISFLSWKRYGYFAAISSILLILSVPLYRIYASSGGYDLCAVFVFAIALTMANRFFEKKNLYLFFIAWLNFLVLTQIRSEAWAYLTLFFVMVYPNRKIIEWKRLAPVLFVSLSILIFRAWHWSMINDPFEIPATDTPFSVAHFTENSWSLIRSHFNLSWTLPYNHVLDWLGFFTLAFFIFRKKILKVDSFKRCLCFFALYLAVILSHHMGRYQLVTQFRYFLPFSISLSLSILLLFELSNKWEKFLVPTFSLGVLLVFFSPSRDQVLINSQYAPIQTKAIYDYLEEHGAMQNIVAPFPSDFVANGWPAVSPTYFLENYKSIDSPLVVFLPHTLKTESPDAFFSPVKKYYSSISKIDTLSINDGVELDVFMLQAKNQLTE
jgi:hypothetical protein